MHVLFNLFAVVLIYRVPFLRELPIRAAETLARVGSENKLLALGYVGGLFFAPARPDDGGGQVTARRPGEAPQPPAHCPPGHIPGIPLALPPRLG